MPLGNQAQFVFVQLLAVSVSVVEVQSQFGHCQLQIKDERSGVHIPHSMCMLRDWSTCEQREGLHLVCYPCEYKKRVLEARLLELVLRYLFACLKTACLVTFLWTELSLAKFLCFVIPAARWAGFRSLQGCCHKVFSFEQNEISNQKQKARE